MNDSVGTRFHFTVAAGVAEVVELEFWQTGGEEVLSLRGSTWSCYAKSRTSGVEVSERELYVEHGGEGQLLLYLPALEADAYDYELFAVDDSGEERVMLYGVLTAIGAGFGLKLAKDTEYNYRRKLRVTVPMEEGMPCELRWKASSVALYAAYDAVYAVEDLESLKAEVKSMLREVKQGVIKRIMVDTVEQIPQSGENCHGGVFYYVRGAVNDEHVYLSVSDSVTYLHVGSGGAFVDLYYKGSMVGFAGNANIETVAYYLRSSSDGLLSAEVVDVNTVRIVFTGEEGLYELQLHPVYAANEECYFKAQPGYVVYAWFENEGWVKIGEEELS